MAGTKEIKNRINSVKDTKKITSAMYLIASTKLRKAKSELDMTRPYFDALKAEIKRIFRTSEEIENRYFYPPEGTQKLDGTYGYLVITADKGLAGAYNQNVIKEALKMMEKHNDCKLYVVGEYGRHYFQSHHIPIEKSFLYTAQNPTLQRAREIAEILLDSYHKQEIVKFYIIYTDMKNSMNAQVCSSRILPFHRADFAFREHHEDEKKITTPFEFTPSMESVLDMIVPSYVSGFIYSALIDSFCSEQSARMAAMDSANQNAQKLLDELLVQYNHVRQNAITMEITEISSGAKSMKRKKSKKTMTGGPLES